MKLLYYTIIMAAKNFISEGRILHSSGSLFQLLHSKLRYWSEIRLRQENKIAFLI